jgi:ribosomal protein S18 acetylase RimI-like enzyme
MIRLSGSNFDIVPVSAQDELEILEVYRLCEDFLALGPVATASLAMVQADLALSHEAEGLFCGIYRRSDHRMMGVVDFVPAGWQGDPASAYLELLMIAAPYRAQGLGAEVVQVVEAELVRAAKIKVIHAGVQVNNLGAVRFWQRMGYKLVSEAELMPDGTTCYALQKVL